MSTRQRSTNGTTSMRGPRFGARMARALAASSVLIALAGGTSAQSAWTQEKGDTLLQFSFQRIASYDKLFQDTGPDFILGREITLHGGTKPFCLVPSKGFGMGWDMHAPKTGLVASFRKKGGAVEVTLERRVDFYLLLLAYHNLASSWLSSLWPGPDPSPPVI